MKIQCPSCEYQGNVPEDKIPEGGIKVRCPKCKEKFPVKKELPEDFTIEEEAEAQTSQQMFCPKCGTGQPVADTCAKCGVVVSKFVNRTINKVPEKTSPPPPLAQKPPKAREVKPSPVQHEPKPKRPTTQEKTTFQRFGFFIFCLIAFIAGVSATNAYPVAIVIISVWVLFDALLREEQSFLWAVGTTLLGPIALSIYFANRKLLSGETREGGFAFNLLKNFAILWTLIMAIVTIASMVNVGNSMAGINSSAAQAGAAIGTALSLGLLGALWFFPFFGALCIAFFVKKASEVETGENSFNVDLKEKWLPIGGYIIFAFVVLGAAFSTGSSSEALSTPAEEPRTEYQASEDKSPIYSETKKVEKVRTVKEVKTAPKQPAAKFTLVDWTFKRDALDMVTIVGNVRNNTSRTMSYVQISYNLYDENGAQVGSTIANVNNLEPNGVWKFETMPVMSGFKTAKMTELTGF